MVVIKLNLIFYKQAATPNRVDKSEYLTRVGDLGNVQLKDTTELFTPVFILRTNPIVYNSNYVYCSFTKRYYYIESIDALSGSRIAIHCKCDVLYTFRTEIKNSSGWILTSSETTDTDADYDMLHNDYPFRQDYELVGKDIKNTEYGYEGNIFANAMDNTSRAIVLAIK